MTLTMTTLHNFNVKKMTNETSNTIIVSKTALLWLWWTIYRSPVSMDATRVSCYIIFAEKPESG